MGNRWAKSGSSDRFLFFGAPKSLQTVTLPTKAHIVRAMVFPVVLYGYENWILKKVEPRRTDAFWIVVLEKTLESPLDCKEIQPVHPKGNQS